MLVSVRGVFHVPSQHTTSLRAMTEYLSPRARPVKRPVRGSRAAGLGLRAGADGRRARRGADGQAVAIDDSVSAGGGHARPRGDEAGQVQGVDAGEAQRLARALAAPRLAQRLDGVGERVLLADEAG